MAARMESKDGARYLNVALGAWLFVSAFLWQHGAAEFRNAWLCGAFAVLFALVAAQLPQARYFNAVLSAWLFISAFALPHLSVATVWNHALVAIGIFAVSLTGAAAPVTRRRPMQPV